MRRLLPHQKAELFGFIALVAAWMVLALLFLGCAAVVPDWHARSSGMHKTHAPEFMAWMIPRWEGPAGLVTIFARVNHSDWDGATLEVNWGEDARMVFPSQPDLSWVFRGDFPGGRHTFRLRVLLDDEVRAERELWVNLQKEIIIQPHR